jgi:hypothetical protein
MYSLSYDDIDGGTVDDWPLKVTWIEAYQQLLWYPLEWTHEYDIIKATLHFCQYSSGALPATSDTLWAHFMAYPAGDSIWVDQSAGGSFAHEADATWKELRDGISTEWGMGKSGMRLSNRGNTAKRGIRSYLTHSSGLTQNEWYFFDVTEAVRMCSHGQPNAGWLISYHDAGGSGPASWRAYGMDGSLAAREPFLVVVAARRDTIAP